MFTTLSVLLANNVDTGSVSVTTSTFTTTRWISFSKSSEEQEFNGHFGRCCVDPTTRRGWSLPPSPPTQTNLLNSDTGLEVVVSCSTSTPPTSRTRTAPPPSRPSLALRPPQRGNAPPCHPYHQCGPPCCKPSHDREQIKKGNCFLWMGGRIASQCIALEEKICISQKRLDAGQPLAKMC